MIRESRRIAGKLEAMEPTERHQAALARISAELAALGPCLPGSVVVRSGPCGKAACRCHQDPTRVHGPFRSWTRKLAGKTSTRLLSADQLADYQPLFDNHRRLKALVRELEELSVEIVERDPRWKTRRP